MKKILVVEDTLILAKNITDILRMEGYNICVTHNGREALEALKEFQPSLIITDLVMAEMDGIEMIQKIRASEEFRDIPIIVLSAKVTEDTPDQPLYTGADLFLRKPCNIDYLIDSVASFLADERA